MIEKIKYGFSSENQLPFFMLWKEYIENGEVEFAECLYIQYGLEADKSDDKKITGDGFI